MVFPAPPSASLALLLLLPPVGGIPVVPSPTDGARAADDVAVAAVIDGDVVVVGAAADVLADLRVVGWLAADGGVLGFLLDLSGGAELVFASLLCVSLMKSSPLIDLRY